MRYYYENKSEVANTKYLNKSDHPLYSNCSCIEKDGMQLAIVQMRFNAKLKIFWWSAVDSWIIEDIVNNPNWNKYFEEHATSISNGDIQTFSVRKVMWALRMKPLKKEWWEVEDFNSV